MRSTPPHKRVPNIAFDCNSLMFVWFTVALAYLSISRPFGKEGHHALIHSMPLSSRWPVEWCPWLLCVPQVVSQAPQHFRASKMQTTYDGVPPPPHQSICSVIFLHSGHIQGSTSTACIHSIQGSTSTEFPKVDVKHSIFGHPAIPFFTFCQ